MNITQISEDTCGVVGNPVYILRIEIHRDDLQKIHDAVYNQNTKKNDPDLKQIEYRLKNVLDVMEKK